MQNRYTWHGAVFLGMVFLIVACARLQPQVAVSPEQGEKVIAIQADSFKFEPNNVRAYQGDTIVLKIANVSNTVHNFTIKDPQGQKIQSVDLPAQKTIEIRIPLQNAGEYEFYCDKPLHPTMGMTGRIQVVAR